MRAIVATVRELNKMGAFDNLEKDYGSRIDYLKRLLKNTECDLCGEEGSLITGKRGTYRRYECRNEHRWSIGGVKAQRIGNASR